MIDRYPIIDPPAPQWTRRDEFAARALATLIQCDRYMGTPNDSLAAMAWNLADAMEVNDRKERTMIDDDEPATLRLTPAKPLLFVLCLILALAAGVALGGF